MCGSRLRKDGCDTFAEAGTVIVEGSGGLIFGMTPERAREMSDGLKSCAEKAEKQRAGTVPPFDN